MSSGKQKMILRWRPKTGAWREMRRDPITGATRRTSHWLLSCQDCRKQTLVTRRSRRCYACNRAHYDNWNSTIRVIQSGAHKAVRHAIRDGLLPCLKAYPLRCTDCSARAICYDHRDYREPLKVDPVCRRCNVRRGPAIDIAHLVVGRRFRSPPTSHAIN